MRYILLLLPFVYYAALAQQKESTVSISCHVNPELYIQAGVIAHVSDKAGNISCNGKYVSIHNKSASSFYYKLNTRWAMVRPQGRTVILVAGANNASSKSASLLRLSVRYNPDISGDINAKISAIAQMNAQSDQVKARELGIDISKQQEKTLNKPTNQALAIINKPLPIETSTTPPAKATKKVLKKKIEVRAKPKTPAKQIKPESELKKKREAKNGTLASATAVGLRIDFGTGNTGFGPNIKHKFNRKHSIDAAILFFEGDVVGLGAQFERKFPLRGAPELDWYVGIGPQFLFGKENTVTSLVPVTGLEYNIPGSPLNFGFDWRPNFYLSPGTDVEAGRFGLSLRVAF
jgi:hypothetical protein